MALKIIDYGSPEYQQMLKLRHEILRKPLGISFSEDELKKEKENLLVAAYDDDEMLGCCMLVKNSDTSMRLRQMAVIDNLQGKGIGKALTLFVENLARDRECKSIMMHARKDTIGFYEKMGYKVTSDEFIEIGIPHCVMEKDL